MGTVIRSPLERWLQFNLSVVGFVLDTQAQLGRTYLEAFEGVFAGTRRQAGPNGPVSPTPGKPVTPESLPPLIRAQWMLGMLFAGWQLPPGQAR